MTILDNIKKSSKLQLGLGALVGIGFLLLIVSGWGFSLGAPLALDVKSEVGRFMTIVILAPILEELFFRFLLLTILVNKVPLFKGRFWLSNITQATLFSLFHVTVYGNIVDKSALFVSAMLFGLVMGIIAKVSVSGKIYYNQIAGIIAHAIINFSVIAGSFVFAPTLGIGVANMIMIKTSLIRPYGHK